MVKVEFNGKLVEAVPVDFEMEAEPWSTMKLADGTTMKVRPGTTSVMRLEGEHDPAGNPIYLVYGQNQTRVVSAGKGLRGEPTLGQPIPTKPAQRGIEVG